MGEVLEIPSDLLQQRGKIPKSHIGKFMGPCLRFRMSFWHGRGRTEPIFPSLHTYCARSALTACRSLNSEVTRSHFMWIFLDKPPHLQSATLVDAARTDGIHLHLSVLIAPSFPPSWYRSHVPNVTHHPPPFLVYLSRPLRLRGQSMPKCPPLSVIVFSLPAVSNLWKNVRGLTSLSHAPLRPLAFECISLPPFRFQCGVNQRLIFNLMLGWYLALTCRQPLCLNS